MISSRCLLLLSLLAGWIAGPVAAQQKDISSRLGDIAYTRKGFDSAVYYYEAAGTDPITLYKLGNAHYRLRHIAEAVLSYERALKRRPGFAAAADNVAFIQRQIQPAGMKAEVFFIHWWRVLARPSNSNAWAALALFFFCLPIVTVVWSHWRRSRLNWLRPQVISGLAGLSVIFIILGLTAVFSSTPSEAGIILRSDVEFRAAGGQGNSQASLNLPEGLIVKVLKQEKSQVIISLPDGQQGTIQRSDIALVE